MLSPLILLMFWRRMISALVYYSFMVELFVCDSSRGTRNVFHLLFVNNTLLFCETDLNQIKTMKALLLYFEKVYGLKVKFDRS